MTLFADRGAWHAPNDVRSETGHGSFATNRVREVVAPDHVRSRVETPLLNSRGGMPRRHDVPISERRMPNTVALQLESGRAEAVPTPVADADALAQDVLDRLVCFTTGAHILTAQGERAIGSLQVGDLVVTRDQGLRPVRWIGERTVAAHDLLAPIEFRRADRGKGTAGLLVSPHHRMLFTGHKANMLFGAAEVLVAAKDLVNGRDIRRHPVAEVTYVHLMFDHHEVIYADGIATESFHATDPVLTSLDGDAREAVFAVCPNLRTTSGRHLEPARICLDAKDARLLSDQGSDAATFS
ncbi:Hint domain-containing protein [Roseovarius sp. S88]|uniref:Hint domain-containing protein n=2 Tax=Roseovarius phycicola TaxID=3080976 RepID=A0ABZ2HNU7_9RHOB